VRTKYALLPCGAEAWGDGLRADGRVRGIRDWLSENPRFSEVQADWLRTKRIAVPGKMPSAYLGEAARALGELSEAGWWVAFR
jgi:hypothetical protein